MNAATRKILDDLKAGGLDISSIEQQASVNVFADKKLDEIVGGGLLRQQEYTRVMNTLGRKDTGNGNELQTKVNKLASLHDFVVTLEANDPLYQSTLERIVEAEDDLISLGHDPTEVKAVSVEAGKGISVKKPDTIINKKVEDKVVDNNVSTEDFQKGLATIGLGSVAVATRAARLLREAEKLQIEVTPEMEEKLLEGIQTRFASGQATLDQVADDVLGLSKKRNEVKAAADAEAIRKAREEGKAEGRTETEKEYGGAPRRQVGRKESPVYARQDNLRNNVTMPANGNGIKKTEDGKLEAPVNAKGEVEYWKLRGDRHSRVNNAASLLNDEEAMQKLGAVSD